MTTSSYASSFGRLQALSMSFLSKDFILSLAQAKDVAEIIRMLESTSYGPEIEKAAALYSPPELLDVALNRHIVDINKIALEATPFSGRAAVRAYLLKWDIHNIELILSSKKVGRAITETEHFLVSSRNVPAGISAGNIAHDEMKIILSQTNVEGVVNQLIKYRYGTILMQHLDAYQKTADLGPMMADLQSYYYKSLLESLKFFQGDEGVIRELFRAQIDKKNILNVLKARDSNLDRELLNKHLIEGGNISLNTLLDIFGSKNINEFVGKIQEYYKLDDLLETFIKTNSLIDFEVALDKFIIKTYVKRLKNISLSIGTIFHFILTAESEWDNIKRIAYGKRYDIPVERIKSMLLLE
ncbi:MAG TPA: V-type ATPase subunit [Nitrososphaeraceae archaeon]|nr:V-type ATPase subunit [Nitrososphaeraceae archaeon]